MAITRKELWQISKDRARKEIKLKETIWDNLFMNLMFFDITVLFISLAITGLFPDAGKLAIGIAVGITIASLIPMVISMRISERHIDAYSAKVLAKAKEIFKSLKGAEERE